MYTSGKWNSFALNFCRKCLGKRFLFFPLLLSPDWPVGGVIQVERKYVILLCPLQCSRHQPQWPGGTEGKRENKQKRKRPQTKNKRNTKDKHNNKGILERMRTGSGGPGQTWERGPD